MKTTNYETPQIEVIEIEIENVLCASVGVQATSSPAIRSFESYGDAW